MILQYPRACILPSSPDIYDLTKTISTAAALCYNKTFDESSEESIVQFFAQRSDFVKKRMKAGHESILEHGAISVLFEVDRGITHEMVRHRICSFTQSSTRYCDYTGEKEDGNVKFVIPPWVGSIGPGKYEYSEPTNVSGEKIYMPEDDEQWYLALIHAERSYRRLRNLGWGPEQARFVLPTGTMARIVWTANIREWRHILRLRAIGTTGRPHPQMQEVMIPLLYMMKQKYGFFFEDINMPDDGDKRMSYRTVCE